MLQLSCARRRRPESANHLAARACLPAVRPPACLPASLGARVTRPARSRVTFQFAFGGRVSARDFSPPAGRRRRRHAPLDFENFLIGRRRRSIAASPLFAPARGRLASLVSGRSLWPLALSAGPTLQPKPRLNGAQYVSIALAPLLARPPGRPLIWSDTLAQSSRRRPAAFTQINAQIQAQGAPPAPPTHRPRLGCNFSAPANQRERRF